MSKSRGNQNISPAPGPDCRIEERLAESTGGLALHAKTAAYAENRAVKSEGQGTRKAERLGHLADVLAYLLVRVIRR
jgi:hypothetical protein